eukprot:364108-Chlamydomonas_euryale.AAC.5
MQMTSSSGHANLLTAPADSEWHTVRKAIARSFAWHNVKQKLPLVVGHPAGSCWAPSNAATGFPR